MAEWKLERDPDNGFLIGPDGSHYANKHQVAYYALLHLCGCGLPEEAFNFCREILGLFDRRGDIWFNAWFNVEDNVAILVKNKPEITAHVLAHLLTYLGLLEHGTSVGGSWLTENGKRIVDLSPATTELIDQEEPG